MKELKFEKKSKPNDVWDKKGIIPKFCPDYKSFIFSKRCRLEKECKNAKKIRHILINSDTREVSVSLYSIKCNGRLFVCKNCKREFMTWDEAATCYSNHGTKSK